MCERVVCAHSCEQMAHGSTWGTGMAGNSPVYTFGHQPHSVPPAHWQLLVGGWGAPRCLHFHVPLTTCLFYEPLSVSRPLGPRLGPARTVLWEVTQALVYRPFRQSVLGNESLLPLPAPSCLRRQVSTPAPASTAQAE